MGKIRYINNNDYDFIYQSIIEYKPHPIYGIHQYIKNIFLENKLVKTLVYEDDFGNTKAYSTLLLKPASFFKEVNANLPVFKKYIYLIKNKLSTYESSYRHLNIDKDIAYIANNLFNIDSNFMYMLFTYSKTKDIKARELHLLLYEQYLHEYKYSIGMVLKDNIKSIKSLKRMWGDKVQFYDLDDKSDLIVIQLDDIKDIISQYQTNHLIELENIYHSHIGGGGIG